MEAPKIVFLSHIDINLYLFRLPLMKALVEKGWEVFALTPEGDYVKKFEKYNIKWIEYKIERKSLNPLRELKTILEIRKRLEEIKPHILHTFTAKPNIYGTIAGKFAKVPIIVNTITGLGSFFVEKDLKSSLIRFLIINAYKLTFKFSDAVIFQNSDDLELFNRKKVLDPRKAFLIKGSGVDTDVWKPLKKNKGENHLIRVVTVGRLIKHKGIEEFIKVAEILKKKFGEKVEFILIGDFYDGNPFAVKRELIEEATKKGIVKHYRWLSPEGVREILQNSDIFVLLSDREGIPRSGLEALAVGLPIITYKVPGCKEIVEDGKNGFFVRYKDINDIVQKLERLIEDSRLREQMSKHSRQKVVEEFDTQKVVSQYLSLYRRLIKGKLPNIRV